MKHLHCQILQSFTQLLSNSSYTFSRFKPLFAIISDVTHVYIWQQLASYMFINIWVIFRLESRPSMCLYNVANSPVCMSAHICTFVFVFFILYLYPFTVSHIIYHALSSVNQLYGCIWRPEINEYVMLCNDTDAHKCYSYCVLFSYFATTITNTLTYLLTYWLTNDVS